MKKWILSKWNDPVWSKVFAAIIFSLISAITVFIIGVFKKIPISDIASETFEYLVNHYIQVNLFTVSLIAFFLLVLLIPLLVPIWRFIKKILKISPEIIFYEDFSANSRYWGLNYWGSTNPRKTNRIEKNEMVFEANTTEWKNPGGENGACYDLKRLKVNRNYEISCLVKSSVGGTMGFKLWLHDTEGKNSITDPTDFETPPSDEFREYKRVFEVNQTKAIRIHLHCRTGTGSLHVKEVKVRKITTVQR